MSRSLCSRRGPIRHLKPIICWHQKKYSKVDSKGIDILRQVNLHSKDHDPIFNVSTADLLARLDTCNVIYLGYIGSCNDSHNFKFGISRSIKRRFQVHTSSFDTFKLCFLAEYDRNHAVEKTFADVCRFHGILMHDFLAPKSERNQKEVLALPRLGSTTYAHLVTELHEVILHDSSKNSRTLLGSMFVRDVLMVDTV